MSASIFSDCEQCENKSEENICAEQKNYANKILDQNTNIDNENDSCQIDNKPKNDSSSEDEEEQFSLEIYEKVKEIEDLKRHLRMERMLTSKALEELVEYINKHSSSDKLVQGFTKHSKNPYKECKIL